MTDAVLILNAGSSSLKFALFQVVATGPVQLLHGEIEAIGTAPHMIAKDAKGQVLAERHWPADQTEDPDWLFTPLFAWIDDHLGGDRLIAVGHRVVHGGAEFSGPVLIDDQVLAKLEALIPLAPLHQPRNLAAVNAAKAARPGLAQIACFDTAFHHGHGPVVARVAIPRSWEAAGVRRYGFHGLSYEYVAGRLATLDPVLAAGKVVIAHLGAGASLCALEGGISLDTTMGFSALDGLVMGTRPGAVDPGVLLYLLREGGLSVDALETLLYHQSGLLGVSGLSSDMRDLLDSTDPHARDAVELFVFHVARQTAALIATLGGLDGVVFTAGIGEHAPAIRAAVAERLGWLGLRLDAEANGRGAGCIGALDSRVKAWVIPTNEEMMIARHSLEVLGLAPRP